MKKWLLLIALLVVAFFGAFAGWTLKPVPKPPPQLPPQTVYVDRVKKIEVPVEVVREVPGPVKIVERVEWKTREVEVPKEVIKVVEKAADLGSLFARAFTKGDKYEGVVNGQLKWGWKGTINCDIRAAPDDPWVEILKQPFDIASSMAISTQEPQKARWTVDLRAGLTTAPGLDLSASWHRRRLGWYAGLQYDTDPQTWASFDYQNEVARLEQSDSWRLYGGVSFRIGRR